jgi:hypothetical protein
MKFFFSPVRAIGFFAKVFGIDALSNFVDQFNKVLEKLFGGIFDFVVNLLEGQSFEDAAKNAFGDGLQTIFDFVKELGRAAELIFKIVKRIIDTLLGSFNTSLDSGFMEIITSIFETLTSALSQFNELILEPLSRGDVFGAAANIVPLVLGWITELASIILAIVNEVDFLGIFATVAATISNLMFTAIAGGISAVGELIGIDVSGLLSSIAATMQANLDAIDAGGVGGVFAVVANTIAGLFITALEAAFLGIGATFGVDVTSIITDLEAELGEILLSIQNIFLGADGSSIFDSIGTILDNLATGISNLLGVFSGGEGDSAEEGVSLLQRLVDILGDIVLFSLDTVVAGLELIDGVLSALAELDPNQLTALAIAIFAIVAAFNFAALVAGALAIGPILLTLGTIILIAEIIINAAENIDTLIAAFTAFSEGDWVEGLSNVATFVGDTLMGIAQDVLDFFGVDLDVEASLRNIFDPLGELLGILATEVVNSVKDTITEAIDSIKDPLDEAIEGVAGFIGFDLGLGSGATDAEREARIQEMAEMDTMTYAEGLEQAASILADAGFTQTFTELIFSSTTEDAWVDAFMGDASAQDMAARMAQLTFEATQIATDMGFGSIDLSGFEFEMTEEGLMRFHALLSEILGQELTFPLIVPELRLLPDNVELLEFGPESIIESTEPVTVAAALTILPTDEILIEGFDGDIAPEGTEDNIITREFRERFDITQLTSPEDFQALREEIIELVTNLTLLQDEFENVVDSHTPAVEALLLLDTTMFDTRTTAELLFTTLISGITILSLTFTFALRVVIIPALQAFINELYTIIRVFPLMTAAILGSTTLMSVLVPFHIGLLSLAFERLRGVLYLLRLDMVALKDAAVEMLSAIQEAAAAAASAREGGGGGEGNEGGPTGRRAIGGRTLRTGLYQITERGSEILYENGQAYLLAGANGRVAPISDLPNLMSSASSSGARAQEVSQQTTNNITENIVYEAGDVYITIPEGANAQQMQVAVERALANERDSFVQQRSVRSNLRTTHR